MIRVNDTVVSTLGQRAAQLEELCEFLAEALQGDPVTARAGIAVEGLGSLAQRLARDLFELADPTA